MQDGEGLQCWYAGRGMSMWWTMEEAQASYNAALHTDGIERATFPFWRTPQPVEPSRELTGETIRSFARKVTGGRKP